MSKNPKKMSKNIRRVLCYTLALLLFATISVMAQTEDTLCANHTEHTEDCGYVEAQAEVACDMECTDTLNGEVVHKEECAYTEAVEESECTHSCDVCDPELASTLSTNSAASTDSTAEEPDVAQEADEAEVTTDDVTTEDVADATDETDAATDETADESNTADVTDEADASEVTDDKSNTADSSDASEDEAAVTDDADTTEDSTASLSSIETLDNSSSVYAISIETKETTLTSAQSTINLVSETTGVLSVAVDLSQGETGRYIDIYLTDYGMTLSSTLPSADGNVTSVESRTTTVELADGVTNTVSYLRLYINDVVEDTVSVDVNFVTSTISDAIDALWGSTGTLPTTGFKVYLYNGDGTVLNSATYGEWVPENPETTAAFTVASSYNSYITNYPDLPSYYSDTSYYKNGRWYMRISLTNLYSSGDVRRENLESVKIYVPDPTTLAEVTSITVERSTTGITAPTFTTSFDSSQIQQDADGYYYEFEFSNTDAAYKTDYSGYIYIYVVLKKADESTASPGDTLGTYEMQLVTRSYGDDDTNIYTTSYTPQMRSEIVVEEYYASSSNYANGYHTYRYYGGTAIPTTVTTSSTSAAHTVEPGTTGGSDTIAAYQASGIQNQSYNFSSMVGYSHTTDYVWPTLEGSTEEWEFPYEIQPTRLTYYLYSTNYTSTGSSATFASVMEQAGISDINEALEVTYTTSEDHTYTASISYSGRYLYIDFDQLEDGEYVVSATTTWLKWVEYVTTFQVLLTYNVPETHEDGSAMAGGEMFQVEHVWKDAEGSTITDSTQTQYSYTHIWFMVKNEYCPQFTWSGTTDTELVIMSDEDTYTLSSTLQVSSTHANAADYMDTVENPQIKLAIQLVCAADYSSQTGTVSRNMTAGWYDSATAMFLTGKMTVMPFLAGWTITYTTELTEGEQTYTIPDTIPEEGLEINLLSEGDRFSSVLVLSYDGEVSGWSSYPELIKDIEYAFWRTDASGNSIMANATNPSYAERYSTLAYLWACFCSDSCSGVDASSGYSHTGSSSIDGNTYTYAGTYLKNFIYTAVLQFSLYDASVSVSDVYQGEEAELSISFKNAIGLVGGASNAYGPTYRSPSPSSPVPSSTGYMSSTGTVYYSTTASSTFLNKYYGMNGSAFYAQIPYESSPTFYVELLADDVTYYYDAVTAVFGNPEVETSATVEIIEADGSTWLKITPDEIATTAGINNYSNSYYTMLSTVETLLYALPGATTGTRSIIGDVYMDLHVEELTSRFDGTDEDYPYLVYEFTGLVADEHDLLGTGDTETALLYQISTGATATVYEYLISGVQIYPGTTSSSLATETRITDIYNHDADGLVALVTISGASSTLTNYTSTIYLPRANTSANGTLPNDPSTTSATSAIDMYLSAEPTILVATGATNLVITYSTDEGATFVSASQIDDWSEVDAIRITMDTLEEGSAVNLNLSLWMNEQTEDMKGESSYLSCEYSYTSSRTGEESQQAEGTSVLAVYTFNLYELSGVVWYDANENGVRSGSNETGMEGVSLTIKRTGDDSEVKTITTGEDGTFSTELTEGENLYIEITLPSGYKLTAKSSATDITTSATDSDFDRDTNTVTLPTTLRNGTYQNISAGLILLPVISAKDVTVAVGETATAEVDVTWAAGTATINYEQAQDTTVATVDTDGTTTGTTGTITGITANKSTEAIVWVENSLGDRVEATYTINVIENPVSFTLTKELTEAASSDETFVFKVTDEDNNSFYVTLTVAKGATSASINVVDLAPGDYTVVELATNWRYSSADGSTTQTKTLDDADDTYSFTFANTKTNNYWVSDSAKVTNKMQSASE